MPGSPSSSTSRSSAGGSGLGKGFASSAAPQCPPTNTTGQPEITAKKKVPSTACQLQLKVIRTGLVSLKGERKDTEELISLLNQVIKDLDGEIEQVAKLRDFAGKARLFQHGLLTQETPYNQLGTCCVSKDETEDGFEEVLAMVMPGTSSGFSFPFGDRELLLMGDDDSS